jgi:hypothetical protein
MNSQPFFRPTRIPVGVKIGCPTYKETVEILMVCSEVCDNFKLKCNITIPDQFSATIPTSHGHPAGILYMMRLYRPIVSGTNWLLI